MIARNASPAEGADLVPFYIHADDPRSLLGPRTLAIFGFGDGAPRRLDDPRYLHIGLQPAQSPAPYEVWRSCAEVRPWRDGGSSSGTSTTTRGQRGPGRRCPDR